MKRQTVLLLATVLLSASIPGKAYATEKINKVTVSFKVEGYDEYGYPEITADTNSSHYSCGTVDLENVYSDEDDDDYTTSAKSASEENYVVELSADDGYAFYLTKASQVTLKGAGAQYVKASRLDNGTTLRLTVKLTELEDICDTIDRAFWEGNGIAKWEPSMNATKYKLVLSRNNSAKVYYTGGTQYDFKPVMLREGDYSLKIYPMSKSGYRAEGAEAGSFHVTQEMAKGYKDAYAVETETRLLENAAGDGGPGTIETIYKNTGWKQDATGWWYQNNDGSYLQYDWTELNGNWYFFGTDGYMVTDKVVKYGPDYYYFDEIGKMAVSRTVPDGRRAGADGVLTGKISDAALANGLTDGSIAVDETNYGPAFDKKKASGPASE